MLGRSALGNFVLGLAHQITLVTRGEMQVVATNVKITKAHSARVEITSS